MHTRRIATLALLATSCFNPGVPEDTEAGTGDPATGETSGPSSGPTTETSGPTTTDPTTSTTETTTGPTTETDPTEDTTATETDPTQGDSSSTGTGGAAVCGDGEVEGDEVCDDGTNDGTYGGCASDCSAFGPFCGDGEENGTEDCDDGDEVQGNGCNNDCIPSGLELWTYEEHVTPEDLCVDVVAAEAGHMYLAAQIENLDGAEDADAFYVQRLSGEGNVEWTREYAPFATPTAHDYRPVAAASVDGGVAVVGTHRTDAGLLQPYTDVPLALFAEANGDVVWSRLDDFAIYGADVTADPDGSLVVGAWADIGNDLEGAFYRVSSGGDLSGGPSFEAERLPYAHAVVDGAIFVAGVEDLSSEVSYVQRKNDGFGGLWSQAMAPYRVARDVAAVDLDAVYAVGGPYGGTGSWIARFDAGGSQEWLVDENDVAAFGYLDAVAIAAEGDVFVAGRRDGAPWLARLTPQGEIMWSRSADEAGEFSSIAVPAAGGVVACGTINGGGQGDNIFVATYSP